MKTSIVQPCPAIVLLCTLAAAGCTMKKQEAPAVSGPSEFGTSLGIAITPDILQQDGASQSVVTVTARGPNGAAVARLPLRAEIRVDGVAADFGALSARNLVTDGSGRAMLTYTAPPASPVPVDAFTVVDIGITPVGSDFGNSATRFASLRLVPRGVVAVPDGLQPSFTFTPSTPTDHQTVLFDGSASRSPSNNPIVSYAWNFGDGGTASGVTATHAYSAPGTYVVRLTVADGVGRSASSSQSLTVGPGVDPSARFVFSPTQPLPNTQVNFNASATIAAPGRRIVDYSWDFGDGTANGTGVQTSHVFRNAGTYTVTLKVTDDTGRSHSVSQPVPIGAR